MTLRLRRTLPDAAMFVPRFFERSPLFWPVLPAARVFEDHGDWPSVDTYGRVFGGAEAPISFVPSTEPIRRRGEPIDAKALYDGRIVHAREVPTRPRSWHDFMNALVWATFPRAKLALHGRQHVAVAERIAPGATVLPNARTRELDILALIDEGGVIVLATGNARRSLVFGHALYEGLVLEQRATMARAVYVGGPETESELLAMNERELVAHADAALALLVADRNNDLIVPDPSSRIAIADLVAELEASSPRRA